MAGREQGRILQLRDGHLEEVADLTEEQPRRHDQGGWSQSRYQRHIDELAADHFRDLAHELDRRLRASGQLDVVVVAPDDARAELASHFTQEVERALAGWAHAEAHASEAELLEHVRPLLDERRAARESALLERWREGSAHGRSATGWDATLGAINESRVETLLRSARRPPRGAPLPLLRLPLGVGGDVSDRRDGD